MDEPLETIDETMETSSSQAFADLQRQRSLLTTRVTRSQSAEGFQTPMQGDTPLHATIRSIAEEVASQADRRAAAINPSFDDPPEDDDQPADAQNDGNPLRHMQVPKHMFEKISAFHFAQYEKYKINNFGTDQGQHWINLKSVFEQIDLLTLFLGVRTQPVSNRMDNAYGYTEGYKSVYENISYTVGADDINKYSYDVRKLFGLMVLSFDTNYRHISQDGFLQRDGYMIYQDAKRLDDCGPMSVQGAFGPAAQPTKRGLLTPLGLDAILLPGMGNQTLVSLSQFCDGGTSGQRNIGVFTNEGCRMFTLTSALPALQLLGESGHEVARGIVQDGIYVQESA
jgi:hypothetical protein